MFSDGERARLTTEGGGSARTGLAPRAAGAKARVAGRERAAEAADARAGTSGVLRAGAAACPRPAAPLPARFRGDVFATGLPARWIETGRVAGADALPPCWRVAGAEALPPCWRFTGEIGIEATPVRSFS